MSDPVVVITGATAGVGRATAQAFARAGWSIGLVACGEAGLEATREALERLGATALTLPTDVADPDAVEQAAAQVEAQLGPIDVWVNNAMTTIFAPFHRIRAGEFERATAVTYLGTVHGTMAALRRMRPRDRGTIVQVGSALAYRAIPLQSAYCGAKHAIRGFTDSLRCELMHDDSGVHVTMVQLPALNTPQFGWCRSRLPEHPQPVPPIFQPEVAARAILWAATHRRREVHVGWPAVRAIWGNKFAPWLADRVLARQGYGAQQTGTKVAQDRPDNLERPVDADLDRGPHGIFDARATGRSLQWWVTTHRATVAGAALGLLLGAVALVVGLT
ncbi:MAG: SDR family oxidoreductase, partial [Myxococcales bacterium]|nr:SDR family oxidoreductase [Myxococcales bacterium]